jgi:type VI secretion system protein ImpE
MNVKELIAEGRLSEARAQLTADVKATPSNTGKRTLLFQVLAFLGEWEKADRHLDMIASLDPSSETGGLVYRNLLAAEKRRADVFRAKRLPDFLSPVPAYVETWLVALDKAASGRPNEAADLIGPAEDGRTPLQGTVNGQTFLGFSDTDTILGPFLELMMHDRYIWVPFDAVAELSVSAPATLLDLLWIQARLTTWEGLNVQGYLPVLYPGSPLHEDEQVRLGRRTEWIAAGDSLARGAGQHVYQAGESDVPLLEIREVAFLQPRKER